TNPGEANALYGEAISILRQLTLEFPSFQQYRLRLAGLLESQSRYLHRLSATQDAQLPKRPANQSTKAVALLDEAIQIMRQLVALDPDTQSHNDRLKALLDYRLDFGSVPSTRAGTTEVD